MSEILHLIIGYFGLGVLATAGSIAGAIFVTAVVPPPFGDNLRRIFIEGAIICALATTIYGKGRFDEKQEWNAAIAAQIKIDNDAHDGAVNDVSHGVRDHYDRDKQASRVRPLARDLILSKTGQPGNREPGPRSQSNR